MSILKYKDPVTGSWIAAGGGTGGTGGSPDTALIGTSEDFTPTAVAEAVKTGRNVSIEYDHQTLGTVYFCGFHIAEAEGIVFCLNIFMRNSKFYIIELYGNLADDSWGHYVTTLAKTSDIPQKLPSPYSLTIGDQVYDGSAAVTVGAVSALSIEEESTDRLKRKTAVFLGDSLCAGKTVPADAGEFGYGWGGIIGRDNNMTWQNFGRDGATVVHADGIDPSCRLSSQVEEALTAHPGADYVIFEGGFNDGELLSADGIGVFSHSGYSPSVSATDFTAAFEALVYQIITAFPAAKIGYIIPQKMGVSSSYSGEDNLSRRFFDRAAEVCRKWGIPVLDLWNECPLNPNLSLHYDSSLTADEANTLGKFYTDGRHLTLAGYHRIAPQIEVFMRTL